MSACGNVTTGPGSPAGLGRPGRLCTQTGKKSPGIWSSRAEPSNFALLHPRATKIRCHTRASKANACFIPLLSTPQHREPWTNLFKVMNTIHSAVVMTARYFKDCFDSGWLKVTAEEDQLRDKIPTDLKNKQADSEGQDSALKAEIDERSFHVVDEVTVQGFPTLPSSHTSSGGFTTEKPLQLLLWYHDKWKNYPPN